MAGVAAGRVCVRAAVDARLPCCHHVRKAHKAARAPKGPKGSESPRKKNADATPEETDDQFSAPDEFPEA